MRYQSMESRLLSILLIVIMVLTMVPGTAFAEGDITAPEWEAGYPAASSFSDKEFRLSVRSNEAGKVYFVRLEDGADAPSAVQVKEGRDAAGTALSYPQAWSLNVGANVDTSIRIRGLMPNSSYDVYTILEDSTGNLQPVPVLVEGTTTVPDAAKSGITNQVMQSNGSKQIELTVVVKNAADICSLGYQASDFGVTVNDVPVTFADSQFSGFFSLDNATTGYYTVVFTGADHSTSYTFTDLTVGGVIIDPGPTLVTTPPVAAAAPTITGAVMEAENKYLTVTFSEGVYGNSNGTGSINKDDFELTFARNGGVVSGASINWVTTTSHTALSGGESECILLLNLVGGPATGEETITIHPKANSIYNSAGVAMLTTETTGAKSLNLLPAQSFAAEYPKLGVVQNYGSHAVKVLVKVSLSGVLSYVVLPDGTTAPTAQQIKDHADIDDQPPLTWAGQMIGADIEVPVTLSSGLSHDTAYDLYMVAEAGNNNFSEVKKLDIHTPAETETLTGTAIWHYRSPVPANQLIEDIKFINGMYMAVGYNGTLLASSDGTSWQKINIGTDIDRLGGIAYGNGKYVVVGYVDDYVGRIYTSDDGVDWHETAAVPHHWLHDVVYGNNEFVAVGQAGKILVSDDGEVWEIVAIDPLTPNAVDYNLLSVTYADGKYVATGSRRHTGIQHRGAVLTSDDGVAWAVTHSNQYNILWDVTHGENTFVAVGGTDTGSYYICCSSDGVTWQVNTSPAEYAQLFSVDYDGSRFIAVGSTNAGAAGGAYKAFSTTSANGTNWAYGSADTAKPSFRAVASNADGTRYVAMGSYGNIYTSDNAGTSWIYRTLGSTKTLRDVAWNGSLFVAVGAEGAIQTSTDGESWTLQSSNTLNGLNKVAYLNGRFITVGQNGTILTSADGTTWTEQNSGTSTELLDIDFGGGIYVTGGTGGARISSDGVSWSAPAGLNSLKTVEYGNNVFMALKQYGQSYCSSDGQTWAETGGLGVFAEYPTDMINVDEKFIAVGGYGKIFITDNNGTNWRTVQSDLNQDYIRDITSTEGKFAAVADNGKIIASVDEGETWFIQPSGLIPNPYFSLDQDAQLYGITAGSNSFVAAGGNGIILQSESLFISTDMDAHTLALAKAALDFNDIHGSGSNEHATRIVANMNLMTDWENGTSISWTSSKPEYISTGGVVTRPSFDDGDQVVYLTATITKGHITDTKTFIVDVIAQANTDIADVEAAAAALSFDTIKLTNTAEDSITANLNLITSGMNGTTISWASNLPATITTNGVVTRPAEGSPNQTVTLTATITKGSASQTKNFVLTVKAMLDQDALDVAAAIAALSFNTIKGSNIEAESITSNLNLTNSGLNGTTISWASSKPAYITTGGAVTRPAQGAADEDVILTATITKGTASQTKQFTVRVKALSSTPTPGDNTGSGGSTSAPSYQAEVIGNGAGNTLPVTVNTGSNNATVTAGPQQGNSITEGDIVVIEMPTIPGVNSFTLEIKVDYLSATDSEGVLTLKTDAGSINLPQNMLTDLKGESAKIIISKGDPSTLSGDVKAAIGGRPLVELTLTIDGKHIEWNNPSAPVTVAIPYAPTIAELENPEGIVIWYIDGSGNPICVPNGHYDPDTGSVTFTTTHFSNYAVVYNKSDFIDVTRGTWYYKPINFIAARDITTGTGEGQFSPDAKLTRGQFIVMLMKAYGIAPDAHPKNSFSDAGNTYYTGYLAAAKRLEITNGVGNNMYAPAKEISRQEMFTLLYNALKVIDELPEYNSGNGLSDFSDAALVKPWAKEAITQLADAGTIGGNAGKLNPTASTTRAEMAQVLYNLLSE